MVRCTPETITNTTELLVLWAHESTRVLADRFIDLSDMAWFRSTIQSVMHRNEVGGDAAEVRFGQNAGIA